MNTQIHFHIKTQTHIHTSTHTIRTSCIYTTSRNHHHTLYTITISITNFNVFMRT